VVPFRSQVLQEHWGTIVCGDQYIDRAVVIEVSDGQPTRSKAFVKTGPAVALTMSEIFPLL